MFSFGAVGRPSQSQRDVRALRVCSSVNVGRRASRHHARGRDVSRYDGQERQQRVVLGVPRLRYRSRSTIVFMFLSKQSEFLC